MDNLKIFKEQQINNYLSSIDLSDPDINQIKQDLKLILSEEPAIRINYKTEQMFKEGTNEKIKVENMESITIIFTVDREISPGHSLPYPVSKTFMLSI
jgi:PP-loop superfamily ATP-utilizing enzyme